MSGSILLTDVAARTAVLVACSRCARAGRYSSATLIAQHGAHSARAAAVVVEGLSEARVAVVGIRFLRLSLSGAVGAVPVRAETMTAEDFAADLDELIAIARHDGVSDEDLAAHPREAAAALVPVSRIARPKKAPRTPALQVPIVVWRRKLKPRR